MLEICGTPIFDSRECSDVHSVTSTAPRTVPTNSSGKMSRRSSSLDSLAPHICSTPKTPSREDSGFQLDATTNNFSFYSCEKCHATYVYTRRHSLTDNAPSTEDLILPSLATFCCPGYHCHGDFHRCRPLGTRNIFNKDGHLLTLPEHYKGTVYRNMLHMWRIAVCIFLVANLPICAAKVSMYREAGNHVQLVVIEKNVYIHLLLEVFCSYERP